MFFKVTTEVGTHFDGMIEHLVEVPDDMTEEELNIMIQDFIDTDINPSGDYSALNDDEVRVMIEDEGYEVEEYGFEYEEE